MSRSNVRGPNSALTEFLRSRGISIPNARSRAVRADPVAVSVTATAEEENVATEVTEQEQLDAAVAQELAATLEQPAAKPKRKTAASKSKKRKKGEEDEAYDPENEADYGRSGFTRKNRPAAGQIDFCAECNCRFTVTIYNKATEAGLLCSTCGSLDADEKSAVRAKPRPAAKKKRAKAVLDGEIDKVPKLQDMAIKCIARHIEDVEALGDIGHVNMDKICQIISRNRSLTNDTIQLFLDASLTQLSLYDCANINAQKLKQVAQMCPHLSDLRLHMVGQIVDSVLEFYALHLSNLKSIALRGCFLITFSGWITFFETVGARLEHLEISDTSRFDAEIVAVLVRNCPNLKSLTLKRLTHLSGECVVRLSQLEQLRKLDISHAGSREDEVIRDEHVIRLLAATGSNLEVLDLSGLRELTDLTLVDGIVAHCNKLQHLHLNELDLLTDEGVQALFQSWSVNPALLSLELERCPRVADRALDALVSHSGPNLRRLNLNSLDEMSHQGIQRITEINVLPMCETLDISWIRAVDDLILRRLLENAKSLKVLWVWGNNRVTECETSSKCLIVGRETG